MNPLRFAIGLSLVGAGSLMMFVLGASNLSVATQLAQLPSIITAFGMEAAGMGLVVGSA